MGSVHQTQLGSFISPSLFAQLTPEADSGGQGGVLREAEWWASGL